MKDHNIIYKRLEEYFGDLHWWPAETDDEILVGSILTQNTSWKNVEKAILALKKGNLLSLPAISAAKEDDIAARIRSSGYYKQKASRIIRIATTIERRYGSIDSMQSLPTGDLIKFFSSLSGIGQETLDSILLYVFGRPVMVIDAYTRRIISRLDYPTHFGDSDMKERALIDLENSVGALKNYHACLVELGKNFCRKSPDCPKCPLKNKCNYAMDFSSP
ncbi:MAG: endonuclease III domain-containing protein [Thermoplasmata archaeon]